MKRPWIPRPLRVAPKLDPLVRPGPIRDRYALLINPFYAKDPHGSFGKHVLTPTLALTSIGAATPRDWQVHYWDENLLQGAPPWKPFPQVVGITVHLTFAHRAYELSAWYRRRGARVILGGPHVISCPCEAAPHADALAIGEGVQLWPRMLHHAAANRLRKTYRGDYRRPYGEEPRPRRDLLPRRCFLTTTSLIATRGCHNRCGFCYLATRGLHMPYQRRDVDEVASEFQADRQPYGVFTDNNLGSDPTYLRELCRTLRPLEKIWSAAVTIDVADDPTLVRDMALAGCTGVFIGFETLQDENLVEAHKRSPPPADYARRVRIFHDNGIHVNGSFVFGFDHDRKQVFERTVAWIEENRLECATFHILTPYPDTPLFRKLEGEGRLLHKDWRLYDTAHAVFRPRHMTPQELEEGYAWCYRRLFSHRSIWHRRPSNVRALITYLAGCYLYKRANWLWPFLIRHQITGMTWRPLIAWSRWRHVCFRRRLAATDAPAVLQMPGTVLSPGV